jgi:ABC-type uncharacterized transport system auxiliary subunit
MKKVMVALLFCCIIMGGCIESTQQKETTDDNTINPGQTAPQTIEEALSGRWNRIEGKTELSVIIFGEDGNATVYFGCSCPGAKENAQYSIVDNYLDIAAESRTQRYIYKLENETLYLRTLTEEDFSVFDK